MFAFRYKKQKNSNSKMFNYTIFMSCYVNREVSTFWIIFASLVFKKNSTILLRWRSFE